MSEGKAKTNDADPQLNRDRGELWEVSREGTTRKERALTVAWKGGEQKVNGCHEEAVTEEKVDASWIMTHAVCPDVQSSCSGLGGTKHAFGNG